MTFDASPERTTSAAFVPHSTPFAVASAEGAYLITPDGRRILDAAGGAIVANIGHGRREVAEVAAEAVARCTYVVPPFATEDRVKLVERLQRYWLPPSLTRVLFTSGGSESVEAALRLARQHHVCAGRPERWKVIGTDLSYHGVSLGALSVANHAPRRAPFEPMLIPFPKTPAPYVIPGVERGEHPADALERVILEEGPETVAAFICEPVVGSAGGALVPVDDFWPRAREICSKYGVLLIADEVMTGFGRTGKRFAVEHWGVEPDILVGGKGLAGGYAPIGGLYASDAVVAPLVAEKQDLMFYTFSAHPASCAIADKVLEIMESEDLVARAARMGDLLGERLNGALAHHPNVAEIRGLGLMRGVEIVKDRATMERFPAEARIAGRVSASGLRHGVFFYTAGTGPVRDAMLLGPPFTINGEDIDLLVDTLAVALEEAVAAAG